jgi:hypothetical protein
LNDESTPSEQRTVVFHTGVLYETEPDPNRHPWDMERSAILPLCPWCGRPVRRHSLASLEACDRAYEQELARRRVGRVQ